MYLKESFEENQNRLKAIATNMRIQLLQPLQIQLLQQLKNR